MDEIKELIRELKEDIKDTKKQLAKYEKQLICNHDMKVGPGDDLSTTGPTGLYEFCNKCGYYKEIGYKSGNGPIFYGALGKKKHNFYCCRR